MPFTFNGEQLDEVAGTVADLVQSHLAEPDRRGVAVAVNDEVVPRGEWPHRHLAHGDVVEIVTAVQGG